MNIETFQTTYTEIMIDLIRTMSEREGKRLSVVLNEGNHYQIIDAEQAIKDLASSRMITSIYDIIINEQP